MINIDWYTIIGLFIGTIGAITGTISLIWHIKNDKIMLKIHTSLVSFENEENVGYMDPDPKATVEILAEIINTGRQPTTISSVIFESNCLKFTNIKMTNSGDSTKYGYYPKYDPIRVSANDRIEIPLFATGEYIDNFQGMTGKLIFKTSHKDIITHITIPKEKNQYQK